MPRRPWTPARHRVQHRQSGIVRPARRWRGLVRSQGPHTRGRSSQQGRCPCAAHALRFLAPTTLRPNSQSPVIQTAMSADTRCASALKREPTLPMGVGPGGPCHSWHQPSAVVLVAETASPVLPHARTPTTRSSGMAPAPTPAPLALRALQHRGVRGASRAAGKGAGGTGRRRFCLKQRRVLCRVSRHLWWPRRKAAPCPRTWGADDGGTGRG